MELPGELKAYADRVDARLAALLPYPDRPPHELHQAMRYSCLAPGKRLRPAMCLAAAEAVGGEANSVLDAACSIEMVHAFSLIHDDLPALDNDELRRGQPTCHVQFGEAVAILAGDALFALAFETLVNCNAVPERKIAALALLTAAVGSDGLVGGETADILSEGRSLRAEDLKFIHERKTGSLIAASCQIGAILGGGSDAQVHALGQYGRHVGLAFQIVDDLLNETATAAQLGKSAGSDRERRKMTYPMMFGVSESRQAAACEIESAKESLQSVPSEALAELASFAIERIR